MQDLQNIYVSKSYFLQILSLTLFKGIHRLEIMQQLVCVLIIWKITLNENVLKSICDPQILYNDGIFYDFFNEDNDTRL